MMRKFSLSSSFLFFFYFHVIGLFSFSFLSFCFFLLFSLLGKREDIVFVLFFLPSSWNFPSFFFFLFIFLLLSHPIGHHPLLSIFSRRRLHPTTMNETTQSVTVVQLSEKAASIKTGNARRLTLSSVKSVIRCRSACNASFYSLEPERANTLWRETWQI